MKKILLTLIFGCLCSLASATSTSIVYNIAYTPGARDYYGGDAAATKAINDAFQSIKDAYTAQGITLPISVVVTPALHPLPDTSTTFDQFVWEQTGDGAWQSRSQNDAAAGIIVSAPGVGAPGTIPLSPPSRTVDSTAAINVVDLQNQLEQAIARIAGQTTSSGYSNRARQYPSYGGNVCYHTHLASPSDASKIYPPLTGWYKSGDTSTTAATPEAACDLDLVNLAALFGRTSYDHRGSLTASGPNYLCPIYSNANVLSATETMVPWSSGSGTVSCSFEYTLDGYSCYGTGCGVFVNGAPIGSPTQNEVQLMNARQTTLVNFQSTNATLLANARAGLFSRILSFLHLN